MVLFALAFASNIFSITLAGIDRHAVFSHRGEKRKKGSNKLAKKKKKKGSSPAEKQYLLSYSVMLLRL